jgi:phage shock protein PspC (stress-responsive transcriptional regulator)
MRSGLHGTDIPSTFREMWETRPARPRDDRMVAGVASAVARRYAIDPVLVRVAFVVAAFSGIGIPLYIAGWVALPESTADPSVPARRIGPFAMIVIGIVAVIGIGSMFSDSKGFILPALVVAALLFLLHRSRGSIAPAPGHQAASAAAQPQGVSFVKNVPGEQPPASQPAPPAWDPLGAAPFAWDLPEPGPAAAPPPPRPRRMPVTSVTIGLALVGVALTWVIMLLTGNLVVSGATTLLGVALAVIGTGLVFGAFVRAGRGLIPFALLLSVITWGVITVPFGQISSGGVGDTEATPLTIADVQPSYSRTAGSLDIDLSKLDLSVPAGASVTPVQTRLSIGVGDITIKVPANADVTFDGDSGLGDVRFDDRKADAPNARLHIVNDLGADKIASGRPIIITAHAGAGDVELKR